MKFWKYNFNMSADCRNFLEMVLTNAVMEGETERQADAVGSRADTVSGPDEKVLQSRWRCIQSANDISDEAPDLGILVDEGYVSDDSVWEDGSEQGDVVNGLFAEYENWEQSVESVVVRKQLRRGFEQLFLFGFMRKGWGWLKVNFCLLACFIQLKFIPLYLAPDCLLLMVQHWVKFSKWMKEKISSPWR